MIEGNRVFLVTSLYSRPHGSLLAHVALCLLILWRNSFLSLIFCGSNCYLVIASWWAIRRSQRQFLCRLAITAFHQYILPVTEYLVGHRCIARWGDKANYWMYQRSICGSSIHAWVLSLIYPSRESFGKFLDVDFFDVVCRTSEHWEGRFLLGRQCTDTY